MLVKRQEFHQRHGQIKYDVKREVEEKMDVKILMLEAKEDAPFRSHNYLFKKNQDFNKISEQEKDGIAKKYPRIKTEQRRMDYIEKELKNGTYEPVQVLKHYKHHSVIFISNGFHRVFLADKLKWDKINCSVKYVDYKLDKTISFGELRQLLDILDRLFSKVKDKEEVLKKYNIDVTTIKGLKQFFVNSVKKNPQLEHGCTICYHTEKKGMCAVNEDLNITKRKGK